MRTPIRGFLVTPKFVNKSGMWGFLLYRFHRILYSFLNFIYVLFLFSFSFSVTFSLSNLFMFYLSDLLIFGPRKSVRKSDFVQKSEDALYKFLNELTLDRWPIWKSLISVVHCTGGVQFRAVEDMKGYLWVTHNSLSIPQLVALWSVLIVFQLHRIKKLWQIFSCYRKISRIGHHDCFELFWPSIRKIFWNWWNQIIRAENISF